MRLAVATSAPIVRALNVVSSLDRRKRLTVDAASPDALESSVGGTPK
ncbi:hypothetical protein SAMN05216374_0999 [Tardiphaga sp. OK246]|nr:hypothetical protein SAMN05216374_0999 [Tardiphaga sp. OK246]